MRCSFTCKGIVFGLIVVSTHVIGQNELLSDQYHTPQEVALRIEQWQEEYPDLIRLIPIGQSAGGHPLTVLQVGFQGTYGETPEFRPAVFFGANLCGDEHLGTEEVLFLVNDLIRTYKTDPNVYQLLEKSTIYVLPVMNPDAAEQFFSSPRYVRHVNGTPVDDDKDGRFDEDGPEDINNDGLISWMRIADQEGGWIIHPDVDRSMRRVIRDDTTANRYRIILEGIDNDKDQRVNEDPPGGIRLDLNFPHITEYGRDDIGTWPASAPETLALIKFFADHPNITVVISFSSNKEEDIKYNKLSEAAPQLKQIDEKDDRTLFIEIYDLYHQFLRQNALVKESQDSIKLTVINGTFFDFCYFRYGIPYFELPSLIEETTDTQHSDLTEWTAYQHPTMGKVEIGGPVPFLRTNPKLTDESVRRSIQINSAFCTQLIQNLPFVNMDHRVVFLGDSLYQLTVRLTNSGWFPTSTVLGRKLNSSWPVIARIRPSREQMLYAGEPFEEIPVIAANNGIAQVVWKVKAISGSQVTVTATAFKIGNIKKTIKLR